MEKIGLLLMVIGFVCLIAVLVLSVDSTLCRLLIIGACCLFTGVACLIVS